MIKRVLFILFNSDEIPTYKSRPDLKDCEFVLGYFCEQLIRENSYLFARDKFLLEVSKCCKEGLIDLETSIVFDVLYRNNIIVRRGHFFCFKYAYWLYYFAAQRMLHSKEFTNFILQDMRYASFPEIIEFYSGVDRRRDDALEILTADIKACCASVRTKCGLPEKFNPYRLAKWMSTPEAEAKMKEELANGVRDSNLPAAIKDQYADRHYDQARPYDQDIRDVLIEYTFSCLLQTMKAGAKALRNSDYASPDVKRRLLREVLNAWEQASKVLLVVLPILASDGLADYDGTRFFLVGDFGKTPEERALRLLMEIPVNVVQWSEQDLFSKKMGPLLFDLLSDSTLADITRHELVLLLINQRPRNWSKQVQNYVSTIPKNSFYLLDIYRRLRAQYRYSFASSQTLGEIEYLIKMVATKHVTGDKAPGPRTISKTRLASDVIPPREV